MPNELQRCPLKQMADDAKREATRFYSLRMASNNIRPETVNPKLRRNLMRGYHAYIAFFAVNSNEQ